MFDLIALLFLFFIIIIIIISILNFRCRYLSSIARIKKVATIIKKLWRNLVSGSHYGESKVPFYFQFLERLYDYMILIVVPHK